MKNKFVIYSNTSRNSPHGLHPRATLIPEWIIIDDARNEAAREGKELEVLAGVELLRDDKGNAKPSRELSYEELFAICVKKLGDNDRLFEVFSTDVSGSTKFIEEAEKYRIGDEAREIVNKFMQRDEETTDILPSFKS